MKNIIKAQTLKLKTTMNEIKISQKASRVDIIFGDKRSVNQLKYRLFGIWIHRNKK